MRGAGAWRDPRRGAAIVFLQALASLLATSGAAEARTLDLILEVARNRVACTEPLAITTEMSGDRGATGFWLRPGFAATFHVRLPAGSRLYAAVLAEERARLLVRFGGHTREIRPKEPLQQIDIESRGEAPTLQLEAVGGRVFVGEPSVEHQGEPAAGVTPLARPPAIVLLVSCDTLRADSLGSYGERDPSTPHLDRLSREARLYEHARSNSPWTLPSHMTLLTGLYPGEHRVNSQTSLAPGFRTLAEDMRQKGWESAGFATVVGWLDASFGFDRGFDPYVLAWEPGRATVDRALSWLDESHEKPVLLFLHLFDAHSDVTERIYDARSPFTGLLRPDPPSLAKLWPGKVGSQVLLAENERKPSAASRRRTDLGSSVAELRDYYREGVLSLDADVGHLLASLRRMGLWDRTRLILTADHGEEFMEHGKLLHTQLHEEIMRVPLLARGYGEPGLDSAPVELSEVAPFILDHAGGMAEASLGRPGAKYGFGPGGTRSILQGRFKLMADLEHGPMALYDLQADPRESVNLLQSRPVIAGALKKELGERLAQNDRTYKAVTKAEAGKLPPRGGVDVPRLSPDERERLRRLGYVSP